MTEPVQEPLEILQSLRADGAQHRDPVRFHYLETLAARLSGLPPAVHTLLACRLQAAVADYAARARAPGPRPSEPEAASRASSLLAQLNRDLHARDRADADSALVGGDTSMPDMKSVRRFSEVWSKISAEQRVARAFTRGPEKAGPLNSHRLILRSLGLMRTLSPEYLGHFLSYMDSLLWLEQAAARPPKAPFKTGRAGRSAKP